MVTSQWSKFPTGAGSPLNLTCSLGFKNSGWAVASHHHHNTAVGRHLVTPARSSHFVQARQAYFAQQVELLFHGVQSWARSPWVTFSPTAPCLAPPVPLLLASKGGILVQCSPLFSPPCNVCGVFSSVNIGSSLAERNGNSLCCSGGFCVFLDPPGACISHLGLRTRFIMPLFQGA